MLFNPLPWEVIASTLNHSDHTLATVWAMIEPSLRTQERDAMRIRRDRSYP